MQARSLFDEAAKDIEEYLVHKSAGGLTYIAEWKYGRLEHKMDHLACFAGGMFGLAAEEEEDANSARWLELGKEITNTCHESYDRADTKLGPEAMRFSDSIEARALKQNERYYILRPETVESYFLMWRLTKDPKYRDWGWEMVQALDRHCKAEGGYSGIRNVYQVREHGTSTLPLSPLLFICQSKSFVNIKAGQGGVGSYEEVRALNLAGLWVTKC